eukprot:4382073-Pyramimonas_sp.AAC.2
MHCDKFRVGDCSVRASLVTTHSESESGLAQEELAELREAGGQAILKYKHCNHEPFRVLVVRGVVPQLNRR